MKNVSLLVLLLALVAFAEQRPADAALVAYTDYAMYQQAVANAGTTEDVIDFDGFGSGAVIGTVDGVSISAIDGNLNAIDVRVYETDPVFNAIFNPVPSDTVSPLNFVGRDVRFFDNTSTFEDETITFDFEAKTAFGLFAIAPNNFNINLTVGGTVVGAGVAHGVDLAGPNNAYFIGVVDDAGETFTQATLGGDNAGYYFDSVTTSVTAVPEPASVALLGLILCGGIVRHRRR